MQEAVLEEQTTRTVAIDIVAPAAVPTTTTITTTTGKEGDGMITAQADRLHPVDSEQEVPIHIMHDEGVAHARRMALINGDVPQITAWMMIVRSLVESQETFQTYKY